jgi:hypothetical protein
VDVYSGFDDARRDRVQSLGGCCRHAVEGAANVPAECSALLLAILEIRVENVAETDRISSGDH